MKKKILFLLTAALFSCQKKPSVPLEIENYLANCSFEKAFAKTELVFSSFQSTFQDIKSQQTLGTYKYTAFCDFSEHYRFHYRYLSTGDQVHRKTEASLFVTKEEVEISYQVDLSRYIKVTTYEGYTSLEDQTLVTKKLSPVNLTKEQAESEREKLFYSQKEGNYHVGGIYYGDLFNWRKGTLYPFYSIEADGSFLYDVHQIPIQEKNGEKGSMDEVIRMNADGLLLSLAETAKNETTGREAITTQQVRYNEEAKGKDL